MSLLDLLRRRKFGLTVVAPRARAVRIGDGGSEDLLCADQEFLRRFFGGATAACASIPQADVLFLYGQLNEEGRFLGSAETLRSCVAKSGASITVLAQANPEEHVHAAMASLGRLHANVACTLDRRGATFAAFFERVFEAMAQGASMHEAWARRSGADSSPLFGANELHEDGLRDAPAGPRMLRFEGIETLRHD